MLAAQAARKAPRAALISPIGRTLLRAGVELRTRCRVREITLGADGMADGVVYYDAEGEEQQLKAHVVVLACNGIGTPRLLLNSRSEQFPDGLANRSGQVGRNLMFHPYAWIVGVFDEPMDGHAGPYEIDAQPTIL